MGLLQQLYLLCWKNFTLRRRHKIQQIIELVWPLLIFLILVWVRGRQPPEHMHACHYNGKALPSAGLMPFFQSLMCYGGNECHRNPVTSETSGVVDSFNTSTLSGLYGMLQNIASNQTLMMELISIWNMTQPLPDGFPLGDILSNPDTLNQIQLSPDAVDAINNADLTPEQFQDALNGQDWRSALCGDTALLGDLLSMDNDVLLQEIQSEICNLNSLDLLLAAMRLQGLNNQEAYQQILSAITGGSDMGDTLGDITEGLPLADLLLDSGAVRTFLEQNVSLSENATDILLNSPLTPNQLSSLLAQDNMRDIVCNTTSLEQYLDVSDPVTLRELSDQLCQLSDQQLNDLVDELSDQFRINENGTAFFRELQKRLELLNDE
uniref:Retinal-specific ATP-binding cassette transporter-like n=1 Tax=Saccoglossus kowalevskii TaxID=10224 RepID=A0ABM0MT81_SACKO